MTETTHVGSAADAEEAIEAESAHAHVPHPILDEGLRHLIRCACASGRRADHLDALNRHAARLTQIPIRIGYHVDTAQAFRDAVREEIVLNGVCFIGDHRTEAIVAAVKRIVADHVEDPALQLLLTDRIMRGCSRTWTGADAYFALHELFGSPQLLIKPRAAKPVPLEVTLGLDYSDQRFKCRIKSVNLFALYRNDDIEKVLHSTCAEVEPFVEIDTLVVELMDLSNERAARWLSIRTPPTPPTRLELEVDELF